MRRLTAFLLVLLASCGDSAPAPDAPLTQSTAGDESGAPASAITAADHRNALLAELAALAEAHSEACPRLAGELRDWTVTHQADLAQTGELIRAGFDGVSETARAPLDAQMYSALARLSDQSGPCADDVTVHDALRRIELYLGVEVPLTHARD